MKVLPLPFPSSQPVTNPARFHRQSLSHRVFRTQAKPTQALMTPKPKGVQKSDKEEIMFCSSKHFSN